MHSISQHRLDSGAEALVFLRSHVNLGPDVSYNVKANFALSYEIDNRPIANTVLAPQ